MNSILKMISLTLLLFIWIAIKLIFDISDRYLPSPFGVLLAVDDLGYSLLTHTSITIVRVVLGMFLGTLFGIAIPLFAYRYNFLHFLMPTVHAMRAVPPAAMVPFFLLWFGFSDIGKLILLTLGLGLNIMVASAELLENIDERDRIMFKSFDIDPRKGVNYYWMPHIIEAILPTLRFGLATVIGLVTVAEFMGSQSGLGYLIQTSRSTFSINVLFLCAGILGIIAALGDKVLVIFWRSLIFWRI